MHAFPFPAYREGQRETLDAVRAAFADGARFVVLEAPTGSGKSAIGVALAREARDAYLLTAQKLLQDQYLRDFHDLALMKGRANYDCLVQPTHAAAAPCLAGRTFPECDACPYFRAKDVAMAADRTVMNYAYHLAETNHAGGFGPRELLVLDEAHGVETALMRFVEVRLSDEDLTRHGVHGRLPQGDDRFELIEGVLDLVPALHARGRTLQNELETTPPHGARAADLYRTKRWLDQLQARLATLAGSVDEGDTEWVAETGRDPAGRTVALRPVEVAGLAEPLLFRFGERVLLMSATILDAETYLRALGIDEADAAVVRAESTFPAERRPIQLRPVARLTRHYLTNDLPKLVGEVERLMRRHDDEKGVVHAHTYRIARAIRDGLPLDLRGRLRTHASATDRDATLTEHLNDPGPTVLLTPSMTEGIDLAGDAARWQAICKVPYPYLGDPQVAARQAIDPDWYAWRTCLTVVQAYGRSVRGPDDRAVTYLLDAAFPALLRRQRARLPDWFLDAVQEEEPADPS